MISDDRYDEISCTFLSFLRLLDKNVLAPGVQRVRLHLAKTGQAMVPGVREASWEFPDVRFSVDLCWITLW